MKKIVMTSLVMGVGLFLAGCSHNTGNIGGAGSTGTQGNQGNQEQVVTDQYVPYSEATLAKATEDGGKAVIFFHAKWCTTCRAAEKDILSNAADIPENITILKTDFDTQVELKKKYKIVTQHTFVQVGSQGNEITQWVGGGLDAIVKRVQ